MPQISATCKDNFKLIISPELEHKIRVYCALSPEREWSGVLFYTFEGNFEKGVTIYANDFYLMDQGTHVHTEFDLNDPEVTRYMVFNDLTSHCMGLLHSHCSFSAFFSGEDTGTLHQYGNQMNNFVSLVVCNDGPYVARLTRKTSFKGVVRTTVLGTKETQLFNTDVKESQEVESTSEKPFEKNDIEYIDLNIVRPKAVISDDIIGRFGEVSHKCSQEKSKVLTNKALGTKFPVSTQKKDKDYYYPYWWRNDESTEKYPAYKKEEPVEKQGKLFDDYDDFYKPDVSQMAWNEHGYRRWFNQLMQGSPFDSTSFVVRELDAKYTRAFKDSKAFEEWFNFWIEYMVDQMDVSWIKNDEYAPDELLLYKLYDDVDRLGEFTFKDSILKVITERLF